MIFSFLKLGSENSYQRKVDSSAPPYLKYDINIGYKTMLFKCCYLAIPALKASVMYPKLNAALDFDSVVCQRLFMVILNATLTEESQRRSILESPYYLVI